jgi:hypothetical protein
MITCYDDNRCVSCQAVVITRQMMVNIFNDEVFSVNVGDIQFLRPVQLVGVTF